MIAVYTSGACATLWHMINLKRTRAALYVVCIARAGYLDGARLIEFIEEWARCVDAHGGPITIEDFIGSTRRFSRRTTFRYVALFRRTFPELGPQGLPDGLMGPLVDRLADEVEP